MRPSEDNKHSQVSDLPGNLLVQHAEYFWREVVTKILSSDVQFAAFVYGVATRLRSYHSRAREGLADYLHDEFGYHWCGFHLDLLGSHALTETAIECFAGYLLSLGEDERNAIVQAADLKTMNDAGRQFNAAKERERNDVTTK